MNVFLEYLLQNWAMILVLIAFAIMLKITVFLDKKTVHRMYILIGVVFLLSIIVYTEFHLMEINEYPSVRVWMIAIRYSATPFILGLILFALVKRARWYVLLPAALLAVFNIVSVYTGIVFFIDDAGEMQRGALGYLPYIGVAVYSVVLVVVLVLQSNKRPSEIIPIVFLAFTFGSGLVLPFIVGKDYSKIFCTTIAIGLFVYYVFLILQLTTKDALTGLLNRQSFYAEIHKNSKDITAVISIDMNGLKTINDNEGHLEGDLALTTLASCFSRAVTIRQSVYRLGGDEFMVVCRKTSMEEVDLVIERIRRYVGSTRYRCSIGYCYSDKENKSIKEMVKVSDEMMYADKAHYYETTGDRRRSN